MKSILSISERLKHSNFIKMYQDDNYVNLYMQSIQSD
jgi:hypothetical protein